MKTNGFLFISGTSNEFLQNRIHQFSGNMPCYIWPNPVVQPLFKHGVLSLHSILQIVKDHHCDVIMSAMACQITSLTVVYSTVYSGADKRKPQSSASLAFVRGNNRWPANSPHKGSVTRKIFPFYDVIMLWNTVHRLWHRNHNKYIKYISNSIPRKLKWSMLGRTNKILSFGFCWNTRSYLPYSSSLKLCKRFEICWRFCSLVPVDFIVNFRGTLLTLGQLNDCPQCQSHNPERYRKKTTRIF